MPVVDSTSRDYRAIRDTLINLIPYHTSEWTDHNPSDPGIALLELQASMGDVLHFYLDQIARDGGWNTAISRQAIINQAALINYKLRGPSSAVTTMIFVLPQTLPTDLVIPAGTRVKSTTTPVVTFETDVDLTIPSGARGNETDANGDYLYTVTAYEGETKTTTFAPSDGSEFMRRTLPTNRAVDGTFQMFVDEGVGFILWLYQNILGRSGSTDRHYTAVRDVDDYVSFIWGDNTNGRIPLPGAQMKVTYRELSADRGNVLGNVSSNVLTIMDSVLNYGGSVLAVYPTNIEVASGGEERESIAEAKILAPASLLAMERAVTAADYRYFAERYPGVAKAGAAPSSVTSEVVVTVVPEGGGAPAQALLDGLQAHLEDKKCLGTIIQMNAPVYVSIEVTGAVHVLSSYSVDAVEADVITAVSAFFAADGGEVDFDSDVQIGDVYTLIHNIEGVDYVEFSRFTRTPSVRYVIWTGDALFGSVAINEATKDEVWTIVFTSSTAFNVEGSVSGLQQTAGVLDSAYTSDGGEVSFTIAAGVNPLRRGDTATVRVSEIVGSVVIDSDEFPFLLSTTGFSFEGGV
jgi:hypothetical protein